MGNEDQLDKIYDRIRQVEGKLVDKVAAVDRDLASHVAECGQLREALSKSHQLLHAKVDEQGTGIHTININLAKIAEREKERKSGWGERLLFYSTVAAVAAAVASMIQLLPAHSKDRPHATPNRDRPAAVNAQHSDQRTDGSSGEHQRPSD